MFEEVSHIHLGYPSDSALPSAAVQLFHVKHPPASQPLSACTTVDCLTMWPVWTNHNQSSPLAGLVCPPYTHIGNSWCLWWLAGNPDWQYQSTLTNKTQLFILFSHFFQPLMIDIYWQQQVCTERAMNTQSVLTKTRTCLDMLSMWYSLKYHENTKMITKFMYSILKCY